jgi:hypothetical protein
VREIGRPYLEKCPPKNSSWPLYRDLRAAAGPPISPLRCPAKTKTRVPRSVILALIRLAQRCAHARRRTGAFVQKPFQRSKAKGEAQISDFETEDRQQAVVRDAQ